VCQQRAVLAVIEMSLSVICWYCVKNVQAMI